jgi:hypothetical protein
MLGLLVEETDNKCFPSCSVSRREEGCQVGAQSNDISHDCSTCRSAIQKTGLIKEEQWNGSFMVRGGMAVRGMPRCWDVVDATEEHSRDAFAYGATCLSALRGNERSRGTFLWRMWPALASRYVPHAGFQRGRKMMQTNRSEVARLRQQIDGEIEAMRQVMSGYAIVSAHEIITSHYQTLGTCFEALTAQVGEQAAIEAIITRLEEIL